MKKKKMNLGFLFYIFMRKKHKFVIFIGAFSAFVQEYTVTI
mgnify:CR=1 FL=1